MNPMLNLVTSARSYVDVFLLGNSPDAEVSSTPTATRFADGSEAPELHQPPFLAYPSIERLVVTYLYTINGTSTIPEIRQNVTGTTSA